MRFEVLIGAWGYKGKVYRHGIHTVADSDPVLGIIPDSPGSVRIIEDALEEVNSDPVDGGPVTSITEIEDSGAFTTSDLKKGGLRKKR
jgi:hypothetical protein